MATRPFITAYLQEFRETRQLQPLILALVEIVKQKRTLELMYGAYCKLLHPPSTIRPTDHETVTSILNRRAEFVRHGRMSRERLAELYGDEFAVHSLPEDFAWVRYESVWREHGGLIVGEYGEDSRIAYLTSRSCVVSDFYKQLPGVRHIHSIQRYGAAGEFLVATGDARKILDLWAVKDGGIRFVRRLRKHLAGFTATVELRGEYYFGTDFSNRPNFIETLGGTKYFFPEKAYMLHAAAFFSHRDRYIVALNQELIVSGGRQVLSVFDVAQKAFVFCDHVSL